MSLCGYRFTSLHSKDTAGRFLFWPDSSIVSQCVTDVTDTRLELDLHAGSVVESMRCVVTASRELIIRRARFRRSEAYRLVPVANWTWVECGIETELFGGSCRVGRCNFYAGLIGVSLFTQGIDPLFFRSTRLSAGFCCSLLCVNGLSFSLDLSWMVTNNPSM